DPKSRETPNFKKLFPRESVRTWCLDFDAWIFSGACDACLSSWLRQAAAGEKSLGKFNPSQSLPVGCDLRICAGVVISKDWDCRVCVDCTGIDGFGCGGEERLGSVSHRVRSWADALPSDVVLVVADPISVARASSWTRIRLVGVERIFGAVSGKLGM